MTHEEWKRYLMARDTYCQVCGAPGTDPHHILFRSLGGKDEPWNGVLLCRPCHGLAQSNKITRTELWAILHRRGVLKEEWIAELSKWLDEDLDVAAGVKR